MPKISNQNKYPEQEIVNKKDYVIGTDYYDKKKTKTFPIENLAEVLAEILIEKGGIIIDVGKTSQLVNDGEFGDSRFVEENELEQLVEEILSNLDKYELHENKQNDLSTDGTGTKYPTVDAVNEAFLNISGDKHFSYTQSTPTTVIDFDHDLKKQPSVTFTDSAGTVIMGQVTINDGKRVRLEFNKPVWGYVYCN